MHRSARVPLDPFFSRAGITKVESRVIQRVKKLVERLRMVAGTEKVLSLTLAVNSLTTGMLLWEDFYGLGS